MKSSALISSILRFFISLALLRGDTALDIVIRWEEARKQVLLLPNYVVIKT